MKKRKIQISLAFILVFVFVIVYYKYPRLNTDTKKVSYALGLQIGNNFKNQNIDYDPEIVTLALRDVLKNNPSRMSVQEIQKALSEMQQGLLKKQTAAAEKSEKDAREFLDNNKTKSGVKVTASGLQYIIIKEGEGKNLKSDDVVKAHYEGKLSTGETFDSTRDRNQPAEFRVSHLVSGWSEGVQLIKKGGKIKLFIPPELGYGKMARPGIPANSVLVIEVEIL